MSKRISAAQPSKTGPPHRAPEIRLLVNKGERPSATPASPSSHAVVVNCTRAISRTPITRKSRANQPSASPWFLPASNIRIRQVQAANWAVNR